MSSKTRFTSITTSSNAYTTKIVDSLFDDIRTKTNWRTKILRRTINFYRDLRYFFMKICQRFQYGFPLEQVWEFHCWHSEIVVPRLKLLKKIRSKHPTDLTNEEWGDILDKMIWSFENHDDVIEPTYSEDYDHRYEVASYEKFTSYTTLNKTGTIDWSPVRKHETKVQEGLDLFAKYYLNLWD